MSLFTRNAQKEQKRKQTEAQLDNLNGHNVPSQTDETDAWPDPKELPTGLPNVSEFDYELLPDAFREWIRDITERIQCPPDYAAVGAMVSLSAVIGRQVGIRPRQHDDWTVVPNLWGTVIGRPGLLKSPAMSAVMAPMKKLNEQAKKEYDEAKRDHEAEQIVAKAQAEKAQKDVKDAVKNGDRETAKTEALRTVDAEDDEPTRRRYYTSDTTVEALGELLRDNPRGILVSRDELVGWLQNLDKPGREGDRAFYLEAWNGNDPKTCDRIGRGTIDIDAACVSILGSIQPGPLHTYIRQSTEGGEGADGLMQRIQLAVWPDSEAKFEEHDRPPNKKARAEADEVFTRLDKIDPAEIRAEQDADDDMPYLRFDDEALEEFRAWRKKLEERVRSGADHPAFEAVISKHRSLVPSLALIIHLADNPKGGPVTAMALERAITWAEYLEEHAQRIYAPAFDPSLHAARELDRHIQDGDLGQSFKARDIYLKGWGGLDRESTVYALEYLADLDRIIEEPQPTSKKGGRPTSVWHVNPKLGASS